MGPPSITECRHHQYVSGCETGRVLPSVCVPFAKLAHSFREDTAFDKLATQVGLLQITSLQSCKKFRLRNKEIQRVSHFVYQRPRTLEWKADEISYFYSDFLLWEEKISWEWSVLRIHQ